MTAPAMDINGGGADLTAKYQKLATEYAKLRAQSAVLKKGLLEEQERSQSLQDQINQRETSLRKGEGEMEAVLFRNQQLAKRVNLLQEEAEAAAKGKKGGRWSRRETRDSSHDGGKEGHRTGADSAEAVINEELVAKITENANLRMKLGDIETTFEATVQALRERCEELEKEKLELGCGVKARESEASSEVAALREEKVEAEKRVEAGLKNLHQKEEKITLLQVQLETALERVSALELEAQPLKTNEVGCQFAFVEEGAEEVKETELREKESMKRRLEQAENRCREAEKEREHWKLEAQLGGLRLERAKEGESGLEGKENSDLEEVLAAREDELKGVWESRIEELVGSRLLADSKAVALSLELEAATARLLHRRREGERMEEESARLERQEGRLREEAATTAASYEAQLSVMSEHLASMNSRLAEQEDEIQQLRHQLTEQGQGGVGKKKGKK